MSEMSNINSNDNGVKGTGTDSEGASPGPGRHPTTVRTKWTKEVNIVVMECYYRSNPIDESGVPIRGYRRRMFNEWIQRGPFQDITEQRICDQARTIRKNGWLTELELEMIKRNIEREEFQDNNSETNEGDNRNDTLVEEDRTVTSIENVIPVKLVSNDEEMNEDERSIVNELIQISESGENANGVTFKKVDYSKINNEVRKLNNAVKFIDTDNITETNNLLIACSVWMAKKLGLKKPKKDDNKNPEPWWKRRIESSINDINKCINLLTRYKNGEVKTSNKIKKLYTRFRIKSKGLITVIEELKQRVLAKVAKLKRYNERIKQFKQNRMFNYDQRKLFAALNGENNNSNEIPDAIESQAFWKNIWSEEKYHNKNAEWLRILQEDANYPKQDNLVITTDLVSQQAKRIPNWKAPGRDGVQGFWIKKLHSLHHRIAEQLDFILNSNEELPDWMTYGRTVLCQKDSSKGNAVDNYRPISCLPLMWKLFTSIISEYLYKGLDEGNVIPNEQKGCKRNSRGTKDQLLIDKAVLKDCKRRSTNLAMAWIDYRKAYDMIPHSWIEKCLEMFGIAENAKNLLVASMKKWKLELTSSGKSLGTVEIRRGIFQGDSLSPLLFVLAIIPLTLILRKTKAKYLLSDKTTINHLLFMDDLKLFGKSREQIDSLVKTVFMFSQDIGMEFGIKKCGMLVLKRGKVDKETSFSINLPDGKILETIEEEGYRYLGVLEYDKVKEKEMKDQFVKEYRRRTRIILKSKLNGKNKIKAINSWGVAVLRYGAGIINWKNDKLKELDRKTRKMLTMYKVFHPKSDVDRLYISRRKGGRGLMNCEDVIRSEENNLGWYLQNSEDIILQTAKNAGVIDYQSAVPKDELRKRNTEKRIEKWVGKQMYGQFIRNKDTNINEEYSWNWIVKSDLKSTTEALIFAAQEQALRTNYVKFHIDKTIDSPSCRMCGKTGETVSHILSECSKLAQVEYKRRHDNVGRLLHWKLCGKLLFENGEKWYEHEPDTVLENESYKILWDMNLQCDYVIQARRPDIVVIDKKEKCAKIIDVAIPGDTRISDKEQEKIDKYQNIRREIQRIWKLNKVVVVPIVIGTLGCVTKNLEKYIEKIGIEVQIAELQKTTLLGSARILRKTLEL